MASANTLNQQIRELSHWHQLAFSIALCERMLPNYQLFSEAVAWGDAATLTNSLNAAWDALRTKPSQFNHERWQEKLAENIPDPEDYDMYGVWPAMDAATALDTLFSLFAEPKGPAALEISRLSRHCVKQYIQITEGEDVELKTHPLMQYEFDMQSELVEWLADHAKSPNTVSQLRKEFLSPLISNLGLSIEE
ncbi:YjaG family protein [Corallincola platygyrae]|uniref:YjaG family protein n=2 Tax=Corallincola platygyrae TaxID=1193278 RepID=A0ABW4XT59_9GAMM